jgi:hypothetical protein
MGATCASLAQAAVASSVPARPDRIPFKRFLEDIISAPIEFLKQTLAAAYAFALLELVRGIILI